MILYVWDDIWWHVSRPSTKLRSCRANVFKHQNTRFNTGTKKNRVPFVSPLQTSTLSVKTQAFPPLKHHLRVVYSAISNHQEVMFHPNESIKKMSHRNHPIIQRICSSTFCTTVIIIGWFHIMKNYCTYHLHSIFQTTVQPTWIFPSTRPPDLCTATCPVAAVSRWISAFMALATDSTALWPWEDGKSSPPWPLSHRIHVCYIW